MSDGMKEEKKGLVPRLRFPEFREAGEWEEKPLGTLLSIGNGRDHKHLPDGDIPVHGSGGYMRSVNDYLYDGESVCIGRKGTIDKPVFLTGKFWTVDTLFYTHSFKKCLPRFVFALFQNIQWLKHNEAGGVPSLQKTNIAKIEVAVPEIDEQQKIADCLSSLDVLIAAQADKLDSLKNHKKGLMQQLFPREGETVPRLRFPEFREAGEWEEVDLSTQITLISGLHLLPDQYAEEGEVPYFTGPSDYTNNLALVSKWTERSRNIGRAGDTLITVKGNGVGELLLLEIEEVAMGRQLMAVRPRVAHSGFVFYFLAMQRQRLTVLASGNLIPGLSRGDILSLKILVPEQEEQQRIAGCLSSLDMLIASQADKLDALNTHKKGLMQQLFPNPGVSKV